MDKYLILIRQLEQNIEDLKKEKRKIVQDRNSDNLKKNEIDNEIKELIRDLYKLKTEKDKIIDIPKDLKDRKFISTIGFLGMIFIMVLADILTAITSNNEAFNNINYITGGFFYASVYSTIYYFAGKIKLIKSIDGLNLGDLQEKIKNKTEDKTAKENEYSLLCEKISNNYNQEKNIENEMEVTRKELERINTLRNKIIDTILVNPIVEKIMDEETDKQEEKNPVMVKGIKEKSSLN